MKDIKRFIQLIVFLASASLAPLSAASVQSDMDSWFNGAMNYSDPGAVRSQMGGTYTGGSLMVRTPSRTVNPFKISMPSFSAGGCSGIDAFMGSFSMISSEQLVALGKAIASNAASFAFDLAVSTLSPTIGNAFKSLRKMAQQINQMQINSCEQAAGIVAGVLPKMGDDSTRRMVCQTLGRQRGFFTDSAAGKYKCDNEGQTPQVAQMAENDPEFKDILIQNTNFTWEALKKANIFSGDKPMRELVMTLLGTVIYTEPSNANQKGQSIYKAPRISDKDTLMAFLRGGDNEIKVNTCADAGDKCLRLNENGRTVTISKEKSFKARIEKLIRELRDIARNKHAKLSSEHIEFLNAVNVPIYKMILVDVAYTRGSRTSAIQPEAYAELVALDYLQYYFQGLINATKRALDQRFAENDDDRLEKLIDEINEASTQLAAIEVRANEKVKTQTALMERTMYLERSLSGRVSNAVVSAYKWSSSL